MAVDRKESGPLLPLPALIVLALIVVGAIGVGAYVKYGPKPGESRALTPDAKAYTRNLELAEVGIKATASYVGSEVVEITGKIGNRGDRVLNQVDVNAVFYDTQAQVILRQRVPIVRPKDGPLKPGETRAFRLPFDAIPGNWSRTPPQLVIAGIEF